MGRTLTCGCAVLVGVLISGCDRPQSPQTGAETRPLSFEEHMEKTAPPSPGVVANATVTMSADRWACPARDDVWTVLQHQNKGETAAAGNVISTRCLSGARVDKDQTFTVLQVRGALANISAETAAEYVLADRGGYSKKTYWIPAHWLKPAS